VGGSTSKDLWFCRFGDTVIVLDVRRDRYFQVPFSQALAFMPPEGGSEAVAVTADPSSSAREDSSSSEIASRRHVIRQPATSALEMQPSLHKLQPADAIRTLAAVTSAFVRLKIGSFSDALLGLAYCKEKYASHSVPCTDSRAQLIELARSFNRVRLLIPIEPSCLLDSLALSTFLARRGFLSTLVIGVNCTPFSAHSWVQYDDIVLNDTVGSCRSYTPIGVF
jgi:hypothetical protein